jgi:hypothetical protein
MTRKITLIATLVSIFTAGTTYADDWDITGFAGVDTRIFWNDPQYEEQHEGLNASIVIQPELYWRGDDERHRVSIVGFGRLDSQDDERSHADIREAYWGFEADGWDFVAGVNRVFWGVTESRHLVDIINQTDLIEDIDQEQKLGQPMINLNVQRDFGSFGVFVLPGFRERTFPGAEGRFRTPLPVDTGNALYESSAGDQHIDLAFRYSHYFGDMDIGAHLFDGTSREPVFALASEGDRLLPYYQQMTQVGLDLQYTREAWLWKLEAIGRETSQDSFVAAVAGFEYSLYGVRDSALDVGLLVELLYDGRNAFSPPTAFENDVFFGTRLAFNDVSDTSVLAGIAMDLDSHEFFLNLEAERRFGDKLSAALRLRAFGNSGPGQSLYTFESDDSVQLALNWFY